MQTKYEYTWIDGKFHLREKGQLQWKHLSAFPMLATMDRTMHNERMVGIAQATGSATSNSGEPLISEGWCLHQMWLTSPYYNLVSNKV